MATLAGLALIALSAGLLWSHFRTRHRALPGQFLRRAITSAMLGILGGAIIAGQFILATARPLAFMLFWLGVLLLAALLGMGGLADMLSTRKTTRRALEDHAREALELKAELARAEARERARQHIQNGQQKQTRK